METDTQWRRFFSPLITYFLHRYARRLSAATTVSTPLAERYSQVFGLHNMVIVLNAPKPVPIIPHKIDWSRVRLQHHGSPVPNRNLEATIDAVGLAHPRFVLELMLTEGPPGYVDSLRQRAEREAPGRITFAPLVYPTDIVAAIAHNDIGLCVIPPVTGTYELTLPNKILEAACAELAVIVGPSSAMANFVTEHALGWVTHGFSAVDIADKLNDITPDQLHQHRHSALQNRDSINADVEFNKLITVCEASLSSGVGKHTSD